MKSEVAKNLSQMMTHYYLSSHERAARGVPVVWVALGVPIELLKGFDLVVVVPENHSAMSAARSAATVLTQKAESAGYSADLCSYARIDIGSVLNQGKGSPSNGLPRPDLLISNNNNCSLLVKWFNVHHQTLSVPQFNLDVPFCYEPQSPRNRDYFLAQFQELIQFLESHTKQKFNYAAVEEAVENTRQATKYWKEFLSYASERPSPVNAFDAFVHMAPFVSSYRGSRELVTHYKSLVDEAKNIIQSKEFPVPQEEIRLLWDNIAPWHQLRNMSQKLAALNVNLVCAPYTSCIGSVAGEIENFNDAEDPLLYLAYMQNSPVCASGMQLRFEMLEKLIEKFKIDGILFSSNPSCKVYSLMQFDIQKKIMQRFGTPATFIDLDMADPRKFNEANAWTRISALLEMIAAK